MTATDELRMMLDERGVEHFDGVECTFWGDTVLARRDGSCPVYRFSATEVTDGVSVHLLRVSPEQAIEATLGRGTCHNLAGQDEYGEWGFCCSECGARPKYDSGEVHIPSSGELPDGTVWLGDSWVPWRYCPNCGRKVVDDASVD